jgi:hypothetical protein
MKIDVSEVDRIASRMESIWGVDRLPRLVSKFIKTKFDRQRELFDEAIESGDPERIDKFGAGMIRAWEALDKHARADGHRGLPDTIWTVKHPGTGKVVGIYNGDVSLTEIRSVADCGFPIADLVKFIPNLVVSAVDYFPGSKIVQINNEELDDEIPF